MPNFRPPRRIERQYAAAIDRLLIGLRPLLREISDPFFIAQTIRNYARSPTFRAESYKVAQAMATHLFSDGHRTWREAAAAGSKGRMIYQALQKELQSTQVGTTYHNIVYNNAEVIRSVPHRIAAQMTAKIAQRAEQGLRPAAMLDEVLSLYPNMTKTHAMLIARTETSKATTALTRARCDAAGVGWYVWETCDDERVRDSHILMDGVVISWNEPPSPEELNHERSYGHYHAGETFNCRCYPAPLLEYDDVGWPARVYHGGRIQHMSLARFKSITGGEL